MTEKTEYITASINLLEQEEELNSTELAVLCNLKKFMNVDNPPAFEVGEYYSSDDGKKIFKVLSELNNQIGYRAYDVSYGTLKRWIIPRQDMGAIFPDSAPATAEQIAIFKLAEIKSDIGLIIKNGDGEPLYGNKRAKTHWIVFIKKEDDV